MSAQSSLPILPLPRGVVLFPGIVQHIPVTASRSDIPALLATIYAQAAGQTATDGATVISEVPVACLPMASPFVGPQGQLLLAKDGTSAPTAPGEAPEFVMGQTTQADLFRCGVVATIRNIEGRGAGEFALHVEGRSRVWVDQIYQEQPCFAGTATVYYDEIDLADGSVAALFGKLQQASRELAQILRLAAFMAPGRTPSRLTPLLARRLDAYISSKTVAEAGVLADFMANIVVASYEEKLQVLALFDVQKRVAQVLALLERQVSSIRSSVKFTTITIGPDDGTANGADGIDGADGTDGTDGTGVPPALPRKQQMPFGVIVPPHGFVIPPGGSGMTTGQPRGRGGRGFLGGGDGAGGRRFRAPPAEGDQQEVDEMDELAEKLEAAQLSPEAAKVAERELKRLRKMVPAQAEYTVVRSYLETLAEIPWAKTSEDRLGPGTLAKARAQLDGDHYGLEKVKKRLLEYLAVLRLKQSINEEVDAEVQAAQQELEAAEAAAAAAEKGPAKEASADAQTETAETGTATATATPQQRIDAATSLLDSLQQRRMMDKSPILLLVGPPGVGKTSLARSVAASLGRKFHRISLGGVRDEAEIRGHRRTYVAAMPGLVMQGLRKVGVANPVVLLDEIDKVGTSNYHGDPSAAMLEVLDPEQNHAFVDHYVAVPFDLSRVLFIATANSIETIPGPLLDRMETIALPGYTTLEKQHIALQYLVPKQVRVNGLTGAQVGVDGAVVARVIEAYTREAGVRGLEREIGAVCRAKAVEYAEAKDGGHLATYRPAVAVADLEGILGAARFEEELAASEVRPGVVTGLVAYSGGGQGGILFIEVAVMPGGGGRQVQLTGTLGDVLKESVEVALSWVRSHAFALGLTGSADEDLLRDRSIHVHCPSGAVPKDGPSSGLAQAVALVSLFSGRAVRPSLAMTGELTLRGRVTAVGGIKEKLIGALRAGVKTVLLPAQNGRDLGDLPAEVRAGLEIVLVSDIWEALRQVWPTVSFPGEQYQVESRL